MEKRDIIGKIINILSLFAVIFTILWSILSIQGNPVAKANFGYAKWQLYMAEHYYDIGDYDESIYWYRLASSNKWKKGAYAKNNLAFLYLKTGIVNEDLDSRERVLKLFEEAFDGGVVEAGKNLYAYLFQFPDALIDSNTKSTKLEQVKTKLVQQNAFDKVLEELDVEWEYWGTETGEYLPPNSEEYLYNTISSDVVLNSEKTGYIIYCTYDIYKKIDDSVKYFV